MKRLTFLAVIAAATMLLAIPVLSAGPTLMSYQGQVLTSGGSPVANGSYPAKFEFFTASVGGSSLWSETGSITTSSGLFSHNLGSISAIPAGLFANNSSVWLEVTVNGQVQAPRTQITSAAYSQSVSTIDSATGGVIVGTLKVDAGSLLLGTPLVSNSNFALFGTISGSSLAAMYNFADLGGGFELRDEAANLTNALWPDADGTGGFSFVEDGFGGVAFSVDGNYLGTGYGQIYMGGLSTITIDLGQTGNSSVNLPNDAIASNEVFDEPGIANNWSYGGNYLNTSAMQDLVTVTITIPAPGYIMLSGDLPELDLWGTTNESWVFVQIDESAGGSVSGANFSTLGGFNFPSTSYFFHSTHCQRVYYKAAGTYTFRLEAMQGFASTGAQARAWYPRLNAIYYPTSYGAVAVAATPGDAGSLESAKAMSPAGARPASGVTSTDTYSVDLRELELKAAKLEAEAQKARTALAEAKLKEQMNARPATAVDNK